MMALLPVLQFPDPRLKQVAKPVTEITEETQQIIDDMFETMYALEGAGLAATQVNIHQRIAVMNVSPDKNNPIVAINPEIISMEGEQEDAHGCLSVYAAPIGVLTRAAKVHMRALDRHGKSFDLHAEGVLAICIQHEIDHLNGKLFINHYSRLKFERISAKVKKNIRQALKNEGKTTAGETEHE